MRLLPWYKTTLLVWLFIGVPGLVLAYGFSDGNVDAWFDLKGKYPSDIVVLLVAWILWLCPLWLAPFGMRRKNNLGP